MRYEIELVGGLYHLVAYNPYDKNPDNEFGVIMYGSKGWKTYAGAKRALDRFLGGR